MAGWVPSRKPLSGPRVVFQCLQSVLAARQRADVSVKEACGLLSVRLIAAGSSCACADGEPRCEVLVKSTLAPQLQGCP